MFSDAKLETCSSMATGLSRLHALRCQATNSIRRGSQDGFLFRPADLITGRSLGNGFFGQVYLVSTLLFTCLFYTNNVIYSNSGDRFNYRQEIRHEAANSRRQQFYHERTDYFKKFESSEYSPIYRSYPDREQRD